MVFNKVLLLPRIMVDTFVRALALSLSLTYSQRCCVRTGRCFRNGTKALRVLKLFVHRVCVFTRSFACARSFCSQFPYYFSCLLALSLSPNACEQCAGFRSFGFEWHLKKQIARLVRLEYANLHIQNGLSGAYSFDSQMLFHVILLLTAIAAASVYFKSELQM